MLNYTPALVQLPLVRETANEHIAKPDVAYRICVDIAVLAQETFQVLTLNNKNRLINRHMISLGMVDTCQAAPREVFRCAIEDGASNIILVHNHPSGDPNPSSEDVRITKQLVEAGKLLGIPVLDHVIIGRPVLPMDPGYMSMRESGQCVFT
jgi:DNA repair protein RadC